MSRRDDNRAKCTEHDSKQRTIADCLCTRLVRLRLSQDCLWTRLVHLLLSQLSCGRVVQALLSRKAPVFKEGWVAFQPVFKEGRTAFQQLAFKAGRLFCSWPSRLDRFSSAGLQGWTALHVSPIPLRCRGHCYVKFGFWVGAWCVRSAAKLVCIQYRSRRRRDARGDDSPSRPPCRKKD